METWIIEYMSEYGYLAIFLFITVESVFPPIPSEVILTFGGYMTTFSNVTYIGVIVAATLGSLIGSMILYGIGQFVDLKRLEKVVDRWGYLLRVSRKDIYRAEAWFDKYGPWTVFFFRLVPLGRSLVSIPAGMANMNIPLFLLLTGLGSLIWNTILVSIGVQFVVNWKTIVFYIDLYSNVVYVLLALSGVVTMIWYVRFRRKRA
ncbi:DedA family protein [Sporosarcina sp. CAU 1771]